MSGFRLPSLIGVIHLPALAGAPRSHGISPSESLQKAGVWAVKEAQLLTQAGFQGLILENFGDIPFYKSTVPPETVASMAIIAAAVREATRLPIGINVLRNDGRAALAIAAVAGCDFIRVNVLSGVAATDQGLIEGESAYLLRERDRLHAEVAILGDVQVKHAKTLSSSEMDLSVEEVAIRSLADAVIITGSTTGRAVNYHLLEQAGRTAKAHGIPLYVGSGASTENIGEIRGWAQGVIVGSSLRKGGKAGAPLDPKRTRAFSKSFRAVRKK